MKTRITHEMITKTNYYARLEILEIIYVDIFYYVVVRRI